MAYKCGKCGAESEGPGSCCDEQTEEKCDGCNEAKSKCSCSK